MTIDYQIVSEENRLSSARIHYDKRLIELGCNMEAINAVIHTDKVWPMFNQFKNIAEFYEEKVDEVITHEIIHDVIYSFHGWDVSHMFNDIDHNHEISQSL